MRGQRLLYMVIIHWSPRLFVYYSHQLETVYKNQSNDLKSWATKLDMWKLMHNTVERAYRSLQLWNILYHDNK